MNSEFLPQDGKHSSALTAISTVDTDDWENVAKPPTVYDPPQSKHSRLGACCHSFLYSSLCGCAPVSRQCSSLCCNFKYGRISEPDTWFRGMLEANEHSACPKFLEGIWWLSDNTASENLVTFQDAHWTSRETALKSAKFNWSVDAYNVWGLMLSINFWVGGGNHRLDVSRNNKWIRISVNGGGSHWIYVIQDGDEIRRLDGTLLDVTPGEDMMRVSYASDDPNSEIVFQYLVRRIAYLDENGKLIKTPRYYELLDAAKSNSRTCFSSGVGYNVMDVQAFSYPPPQLELN